MLACVTLLLLCRPLMYNCSVVSGRLAAGVTAAAAAAAATTLSRQSSHMTIGPMPWHLSPHKPLLYHSSKTNAKGVEASTPQQITAEFRERALRLHPDKAPVGASRAAWDALQAAHTILSNKEKRVRYDTWRRSGLVIGFEEWCARTTPGGSGGAAMHFAPTSTRPLQASLTVSDGCTMENMPGINSSAAPCHTISKTAAFAFRGGGASAALEAFRASGASVNHSAALK
jgi:hypothetical protein